MFLAENPFREHTSKQLKRTNHLLPECVDLTVEKSWLRSEMGLLHGTACLGIGERRLEAEKHSRAFALFSLQKLQSKLVAYKHSV